jgi:type I restriction enzyme M protein
LTQRARELRKNGTSAEEIFWELVRDRRFLGLKFRRQHQFGDYILDFYCHDCLLAVELDGKIHENRKAKDAKRDRYLLSQGLKVIRLANETFLSSPESALKMIQAELGSYTPLPLGEGRGEGKSSGPLNTKNHILMIDARNIYRKVTRKIYDFSPEQMHNLSAIVWLYRGQADRFLALVKHYLHSVCEEGAAISDKLAIFEKTLTELQERFAALEKALAEADFIEDEKKKALAEAVRELQETEKPYKVDRDDLLADLGGFLKRFASALPEKNDFQHKARQKFEPIADRIKGLAKQLDLLYKLAARVADIGSDPPLPLGEGRGEGGTAIDIRSIRRSLKQLDGDRKAAVEQLKRTVYFHRQVIWLQARFPKAELEDVPGLVKLVDVKEIESADWSLTPGRYVGVSPPEENEDFDFEQTLRDIHIELADLNKEAAELAAKIQANFEELGI